MTPEKKLSFLLNLYDSQIPETEYQGSTDAKIVWLILGEHNYYNRISLSHRLQKFFPTQMLSVGNPPSPVSLNTHTFGLTGQATKTS